MGQKRDLTGSKKSKIVRYLAEGYSTLKIDKLLERDHQTVVTFKTVNRVARSVWKNQGAK